MDMMQAKAETLERVTEASSPERANIAFLAAWDALR